MDIFAILILGFVQSVTEWLPLSSKTMDALLYLQAFGGEKEGLVSVLLALHLGTLCAATIYFRKEIIEITRKFFNLIREPRRQLESQTGFFITAILFTGIIGIPLLLLEVLVLPDLEAGALLSLMGAGLVVTGFLLSSDRKHKWRSFETATWRDGIFAGALQGLSTLPGVSRAGTTTTALIWEGFNSESAFHLSFMLSIPTVFCAEVLLWLAEGGITHVPLPDMLALALSSFLFGYLTIDFLIKIARRINVASLAFAFGIMMLLFGLFGVS